MIDITPTPRILRTLGEIPFQPWQCFAELIDNSIDAFMKSDRANHPPAQRIFITWSGDSVGASNRSIEIYDSGPGMKISQIQDAVRAGYSSNDPVGNLGLFGMGFNIATARLGEKTKLLSTTKHDDSWSGVEIDFSELITSGSFAVPEISEAKDPRFVSGTKIIVNELKAGVYAQLRDQEASIRRQLEKVYAPLLTKTNIEIYIQGKKLVPRLHSVWSSTRYVVRDGKNVSAFIEIDRELGSSYFDIERNVYLSQDSTIEIDQKIAAGGRLPESVIKRPKRLKGWVGIQRFADPNDFGLDFIRNGRKILIGNKALFSYDNPMTGTSILEYPVELGSTVGGRIVGELHVDYLIPTYQKNDFDRGDSSWYETCVELRGIGPLLPKLRKALGYEESNTSPIGLLANAFRRVEPGTRNLFIERQLAREFHAKYLRGDPDYQNDDRWWSAAVEADKLRATGGASVSPEVDPGFTPSDNVDDYLPGGAYQAEEPRSPTRPVAQPSNLAPQTTDRLGDLMQRSVQILSWSGNYVYSDTPPFSVKVWELKSGKIYSNGVEKPYAFFADGIDCDFVFNPHHIFLVQFPITPREILCIYLAEKFKARDGVTDFGLVFSELVNQKLSEIRVDRAGLQEKAHVILSALRDKCAIFLSPYSTEVLACIHEAIGEVEETVSGMLSDPRLIKSFQSGSDSNLESLLYVPNRTLLRIVDCFPQYLFDGNVFDAPYQRIQFADEAATERTRAESKDRVLGFLKDAVWLLTLGSVNHSAISAKDELSRCAYSINCLSRELKL